MGNKNLCFKIYLLKIFTIFLLVILVILSGCMGYNSTMERANLSNNLFISGFYGKSLERVETPAGNKELSEFLFNSGFEKKFLIIFL